MPCSSRWSGQQMTPPVGGEPSSGTCNAPEWKVEIRSIKQLFDTFLMLYDEYSLLNKKGALFKGAKSEQSKRNY